MQPGRVITIVVEIQGPDAKWLWDAHLASAPQHGLKIKAMRDGDALDELEEISENAYLVGIGVTPAEL